MGNPRKKYEEYQRQRKEIARQQKINELKNWLIANNVADEGTINLIAATDPTRLYPMQQTAIQNIQDAALSGNANPYAIQIPTMDTITPKIEETLLNTITSGLTSRGFDEELLSKYNPDITRAITREISAVPEESRKTEKEFNAFLNPQNLIEEILNSANADYRRGITSNLTNKYTPTYAYEQLPNTYDDAIIDEILNEQFSSIDQRITDAIQSGYLNPIGAEGARKELENQRTGARTYLQGIGSDYIKSGRQDITNAIEEALNFAGQSNITNRFDPTSWDTQITNTLQELQGNIAGNLRGAIAGQDFFDPTQIITKGSLRQGFINPATQSNRAPLLAAINRNNNEQYPHRRLTNRGEF